MKRKNQLAITPKEVILDPHPSLHKESSSVAPESEEVKKLIAVMRATIKSWEEDEDRYISVGLAAVQINELKRVVLIRAEDDTFYVLINPEIVKYDGAPIIRDESCMSVHGVHAKVPRYPKIKLRAIGEDGQEIKITARGDQARIIQHEVDHTNGILFLDRALSEAQGGYFETYDKKTGLRINIGQKELEKKGLYKPR